MLANPLFDPSHDNAASSASPVNLSYLPAVEVMGPPHLPGLRGSLVTRPAAGPGPVPLAGEADGDDYDLPVRADFVSKRSGDDGVLTRHDVSGFSFGSSPVVPKPDGPSSGTSAKAHMSPAAIPTAKQPSGTPPPAFAVVTVMPHSPPADGSSIGNELSATKQASSALEAVLEAKFNAVVLSKGKEVMVASAAFVGARQAEIVDDALSKGQAVCSPPLAFHPAESPPWASSPPLDAHCQMPASIWHEEGRWDGVKDANSLRTSARRDNNLPMRERPGSIWERSSAGGEVASGLDGTSSGGGSRLSSDGGVERLQQNALFAALSIDSDSDTDPDPDLESSEPSPAVPRDPILDGSSITADASSAVPSPTIALADDPPRYPLALALQEPQQVSNEAWIREYCPKCTRLQTLT